MEKNNQLSVLWLPAWYPSELDAYNGDFLQRHARATALFCKVKVICMVPDKEGKITKGVKLTENNSGNLSETIIYYYTGSMLPGIVGKFVSGLKYLRVYKKVIRNHIIQSGKPALTHVHIADKNGLIGLWVKKHYKIPFVISEQWTLFLPEAVPNFKSCPQWFKNIWKRVINGCAGISVVTGYLGKALVQWGAPNNYKVIPNVVDHQVFFPGGTSTAPTFIHISLLNYQKNFEDIIAAFSLVKKAGYDFRLIVYGPGNQKWRQQAQNAGIENELQFEGEVSQRVLADQLRKAKALVHYSRYETFGCVITEAQACGVPVIASDIPVHHETITEGVNGLFAEGENPTALSKKIIDFIDKNPNFSKEDMFESNKKLYGYEVVGKTFFDWYQSFI